MSEQTTPESQTAIQRRLELERLKKLEAAKAAKAKPTEVSDKDDLSVEVMVPMG